MKRKYQVTGLPVDMSATIPWDGEYRHQGDIFEVDMKSTPQEAMRHLTDVLLAGSLVTEITEKKSIVAAPEFPAMARKE